MLERAKEPGNVSQACRVMGCSRHRLYCFKELYDKGGQGGLQQTSRRKPLLRNRVASEVEQTVVEIAIKMALSQVALPAMGNPLGDQHKRRAKQRERATDVLHVLALSWRDHWLTKGRTKFRPSLTSSTSASEIAPSLIISAV